MRWARSGMDPGRRLKSGRECVRRLDVYYNSHGFDCVAGTLIRRSGWVITNLGSPWAPVAINERGQVVGDFGRGFMGYTTPPDWRAVLWQDGRITFLAPPGFGHAQAINDAGQIIGWNTTPAGVQQNFIWRDGVRTDLGALHPIGLNESGHVAGNSQASSGAYNPGDVSHLHASLWNDGTLTTLNIPTDATSTVADDTPEVINARGQVLMNGGDGTTRGWKVWENGVLTDIGGPGVTHAVAINESGQILLRGSNSKGSSRGFLWERGVLRNIGTLGGRETNPRAINDRGQIVGQSQTKNGSYHAFLWENGKMRDLGTLGGQVSGAVAINNRRSVGRRLRRSSPRQPARVPVAERPTTRPLAHHGQPLRRPQSTTAARSSAPLAEPSAETTSFTGKPPSCGLWRVARSAAARRHKPPGHDRVSWCPSAAVFLGGNSSVTPAMDFSP